MRGQSYSQNTQNRRTSKARLAGDNKPFTAMIEWVMFPKPGQPPADGGFTICKATHEATAEEVVLKGKFGPVIQGELIQVKKFSWKDDARWGEYIQVWAISHDDPVTYEALSSYLEKLPGVGEVMADAILEELGEGCLAKIDKDPSILLQIKTGSGRGISEKDLEGLMDKWEELRAERKNMLYFSSLGIGDATAKKIVTALGPQAQDKIKENPYCLCQVPSVGFKIADYVAQKLGIRADDINRLGAGVEYVLQSAEREGHICLEPDDIYPKAKRLLARRGYQPADSEILKAIENEIELGRLWEEEDPGDGKPRIYSTEHYVIETRLYQLLEERLKKAPQPLPVNLDEVKNELMTDEQWGAIENCFHEGLSILTGGPGVGKTFTIRTLLDACEKEKKKFTCLAPTGKAAKRMEETTGREASTIHRKLGFDGRNTPGAEPPDPDPDKIFKEDVIIVDESSMLDMRLAERLFSHIRPDAHVVLVGDPDQLPAVGAGSVLHDLIDSKRVPTTRLSKIFRQAENSLLTVNAHRIKEGKEPYWNTSEAEEALGHKVKEDWQFIQTKEPTRALKHVQELFETLPKEMGIDQDDIMVTAPSKKGDCGVYVLNQVLQKQKNEHGQVIRDGQQPLRVGDATMNIVNRYGKKDPGTGEFDDDVMNGDVGKIVDYDSTKKVAWVEFEGQERPLAFSGEEINNLIPAYAATTHKLQGSEAPVLLAPLVGNSSSMLLNRNMLYTAWTRGKEKCIVVGDSDAIKVALTRNGTQRKTTLDLRVSQVMPRVRGRWEKMNNKKISRASQLLY